MLKYGGLTVLGYSKEIVIHRWRRFSQIASLLSVKISGICGQFIFLNHLTGLRYYWAMIASFADRETEKVFQRTFSRRLPPDVALRRLVYLHNATELNNLLTPPSNRLEKLSGDRQGQYSIRINSQWRVCFAWADGAAHNVEIVETH
jgi:proteic killer suppression protein